MFRKLLLIQAVLVIALIAWQLSTMSFSFYDVKQLDNSFSHFLSLKELDEYVIAEMKTAETFEKTEYKTLFDRYPIGDTTASIALVAHYKYYIRLSELSMQLEDRSLVLQVPSIYLSRPVAFDTITKKEQGESTLFGKDHEVLLKELNSEITEKLSGLGVGHMVVARDTAARSLAENVNTFLARQGDNVFYDEIIVRIENDKRVAQRKFAFDNSYCPYGDCFKLDLGDGKTLIVQ